MFFRKSRPNARGIFKKNFCNNFSCIRENRESLDIFAEMELFMGDFREISSKYTQFRIV